MKKTKSKLDRAKNEMLDGIAATTEKLDRADLGEFLQWLESEARSQLDCWHDENKPEGQGDEE